LEDAGDMFRTAGKSCRLAGCGIRGHGFQKIMRSAGLRPLSNRWAVLTLLLLLGFETACSLGQPAAAVPCHNDRVQTSPGVILPLASGQTYQVYPTDNKISMMWLPADRLIVCPIGGSAVEITDRSAKNEQIRALQISNLGWLVWPY